MNNLKKNQCNSCVRITEIVRKRYVKLTLLVSTVSLLTACAPIPQRQALSLQDRKLIHSDKIILNSTQHDITLQQTNIFTSDLPDPYFPMDSGSIVRQNVTAQPAGGVITSLIFAGISHHEASKTQVELQPLWTALGDFNYVNYFKSQISEKIGKLPWLKVSELTTQYNIQDYEQSMVYKNKQNTTLFIGTTYALNSSFNRLEVIAYVKLDKKVDSLPSSKESKKIVTLYQNDFYYVYRLNVHDLGKKANILVWQENNAALLKSKLKDAAIRISNMISVDMKNSNPNPYSNATIIKIRTLALRNAPARLLEKRNGIYTVMLLNDGIGHGNIYMVNQNSVR